MTLNIDYDVEMALDRLARDKNRFTLPNNPDLDQQVLASNDYTHSQEKLLMNHAPYIIGTAGAGCGKTHTLVGRLKYLNALGVQPHQILNLSFSNAAVDNLKARLPEASVVTIASMCQEEYRLNFNNNIAFTFFAPSFVNAVACSTYIDVNKTYTDDHSFPHNLVNVSGQEVFEVKSRIINLYHQAFLIPNRNKRLTNKQFISELYTICKNHFNAVNVLIAKVRKIDPSLAEVLVEIALEQHPEQFVFIESLKDVKVLTLDECQDTSTIEMLLMLNIVYALHGQLFLVGDANQTLFEWRSADPEMISTLQSSSTFTNCKLDTNFRSIQPILSYANFILDHLSTNQIDPIHLHDVQESPVSIDAFKATNSISVNDCYFDQPTLDWMEQCIANHEQIAILGGSHKIIGLMLEQVMLRLSKKPSVFALASPAEQPLDFISGTLAFSNKSMFDFCRDFEKAQIPHDQIFQVYYNFLCDVVDNNTINYSLDEWKYRNEDIYETLNQAFSIATNDELLRPYLTQYLNGEINTALMVGTLIQRLLRIEDELNDAKQEQQRQEQQERQNEDMSAYDIVTSTIHSAKGLEFDHVLVLYDETKYPYKEGCSQGDLRALGVALTRAKKSQHVLEITDKGNHHVKDLDDLVDYNDFSNRPLITAYQAFIHAKEKQIAIQNGDIDVDFIDEMKQRRPLPFIVSK